jgi:6-pyruvoyltetrahydropterin/6-carboxytetrahydropterin synthase
MLLTVSKRLEFSASRRLFVREWSEDENQRAFGDETRARYGTGRNYVAWFVFSGSVDPETGMLMNISEIKRRAGAVIDERYDHRSLNDDNAHFNETVPTAENIAQQLARDVAPLFADSGAELSAVYLEETPQRSATAYISGHVEAHHEFRFSAARQTMSPHLSQRENEEVFGTASSPHGHGHDYRVRLTLRSAGTRELLVQHREMAACIDSLRAEFDHRNLNVEVAGLRSLPITTEVIAKYIFDRASQTVPLHRVRLHERDDFFAEYSSSGQHLLAMQEPFSAAHRLHARSRSDEENFTTFGKCNNPRGHGHMYIAEATIGGALDERSGTLCNFVDFQNGMREALAGWQNRHLDLETEEFRERPSSGENIVQVLWEKMNPLLWNRMERLRLWETWNNRFTLRKGPQ